MAWVQIVNEKMNQGYVGHAEMAEWTFTVPLPDQIGASYIADNIIQDHIEELAKQNEELLELKVWEDTSPTWITNYYVKVTSTATPIVWTVIIVGVITLLAIAGASYMLIKVEDIVEYIGDKSPATLPLLGIAAVGVLVIVGIVLVKK